MSSALGNLNNQPKSPAPVLLTKELQDIYVRQNFQALVNYFQSNNQFYGFNFFEIIETAAVTTAKTLTHNLGFIPKDVVVTQITGVGTLQLQYGAFTKTTISYITTGACRVRLFVGTYFGDTSTASAQTTDNQTLASTPTQTTSTTSSTGTTTTTTVTSTTSYTPKYIPLLSGNSTYTPTPGIKGFKVRVLGGGGGGAAGGSSHTNGTGGTATTFGGFLTAGGGTQGSTGSTPPPGGTNTIGTLPTGWTILNNVAGSCGQGAIVNTISGASAGGGQGGTGPYGGGGGGGGPANVAAAAAANSGSGGGGGGQTTSTASGAGGASGGYLEAVCLSPAASYNYSIGPGGPGGTGTFNGAAGGSGSILIEEF